MMGSAPMMKRYKPGIGAALVVFFVMFSTGPARAEEAAPPDKAAAERAKQHFALGEGYFKSKKFDEALVEYQRGYADKPSPVFLFNMAQCQRLLGHRDAALELYRRYVAQAPEGVGRAVAEQRIAELGGDEGGKDEAKRDDEKVAMTPKVEAPVEPPPPPTPVELVATAPATPPPAEAAEPAPSLFAPAPIPQAAPTIRAAATAPAAKPDDDRPVYRRWWFWVAAAAVASGTVVAIAASSSSRPACDPDRLCK
jgi:hypothetical protein